MRSFFHLLTPCCFRTWADGMSQCKCIQISWRADWVFLSTPSLGNSSAKPLVQRQASKQAEWISDGESVSRTYQLLGNFLSLSLCSLENETTDSLPRVIVHVPEFPHSREKNSFFRWDSQKPRFNPEKRRQLGGNSSAGRGCFHRVLALGTLAFGS